MRLLVCIDLSPISDAVVQEAAALARASRAQIVLLHVARSEPVLTTAGASGYRAPPEDLADRKTNVERIAARLRAAGIEVSVDVMQTDKSPVDAILEAADGKAVAYVMMGSHGHSRVFDLVVGSVTQAVLRASPVPVIVVRAARPED
jgi:nucleotide-binding universal stress UspA family protein